MIGKSRHGGDNSGVVNLGTMGNVQNQPGASNSRQRQTTVSSGAETQRLAEMANALTVLEQELAAQRAHVADYPQCVGYLDVAKEQHLAAAEGRTVAIAMLKRIGAACGGVPGLVSMVNAALGLISAFG